jgi:hypothetical protein
VEVRGGGDPGDRRGDGRADPGGAADRVDAAAAELYGADQEAFTDRRKALAAAARAAGDKGAATAIAALRKPTRAAWVVNRLSRSDPGAPPRLAAMTAALRAAEQAKDGPRLRELSAARGALIDALTEQALAAVGVVDPPPSLRAEVSATLTAALADPEVAAAFAAGTLTRAAHWSGFGPTVGWPDSPVAAVDAGTEIGTEAEAGTRTGTRTGRPSTDVVRLTAHRAPVVRVPAATQVAAEDEQRLAREAAERAARQRKNYEEAERTVVLATAASTEAVAAEDRLEAEVHDLEQRLVRARADLVSARLHARRAEAAERRARHALDGLSR